ncbi:MAG: protein kinase [Candidatus Aminicenantes bacterium]|nr:protein kinase [Candidatus Aminicenantes bacterium]
MEQQPKTWGRFTLVSLLGKGGMGDVWKAYDPNLKRHIALKILRNEDPEVVQRFLREARAQARVEHIHVCKIYESGDYKGHPYIAMQYIDGQNLRELRDKLTLEEMIRIMKEAALGLHSAHRQGLIHRDIKPANIMVKQTEEGQWKPYIMDFGIAREQEAPGLTSTGMVVGTPYYMSPEHARGKLKTLDHRSDIYSFGVTLYELFTGKIPFDGNSPVDILMKVIQNDPQPVRKINPRIPVDIDTIVMKCLEKERNRRYNSAKDLAEDLQRYLDGDPIRARPTTIIYRVRRKLTKHKWPALVIGIASVLIVVLFGMWLKTKWTASQLALITQQLGQEVEKIESTIGYAHLLPLHNISREKNNIRQQIKGIEAKMKEVGKLSLGAGNYALGRGYLALQEYDKADIHLGKAWQAGYRTPEVAYERGLVLGELYLKEIEKANRIYNKEMREARQKEIGRTFREPAVRFFRRGGQTWSESPEYIEALIGFYEKKYDRAWATLQEAITKNRDDIPKLYQAKILEGNIFLAIARDENHYDKALENLSKAEAAYQRVIEIGQSDIRGYSGLGRVLELTITIKLHSRGGELQPLVDRAISYCEKALQIDPALADAYVMKASIYRLLGRYHIFSGKSPVQAFDQSAAAAQNAIKLEPENFDAYTMTGIINRIKGEYHMNHGEDPIPTFHTAAANFSKAIEINPTHVRAYNGMGNVYVRIAQYEITQGKDPKESLNRAIANFEKSLAINPDLVNLHNGLAAASWFRGGAMMARGEDPRPSFTQAVRSLEKAIEINPGFVHFYTNAGFVLTDIGRYELDYGYVPTGSINQALRYFEQAVKINPKGNELYKGLVAAGSILIKYDFMMNKDCSRRVKQAEAYYKRGLEVNPNDPLLYIRMAENYILQALSRVNSRRSPMSFLKQADALLQKAKTLNPKYYEIYMREGESALLKARRQMIARQNPRLYFERAEASLKQAAELNPKDIHTNLTMVRLNWRKAEWEISRWQPAAASRDIDKGLMFLQKAIDINPNYAENHALKGILLQLRAQTENKETERLTTKVEARVSLLKGMEINKNLQKLYAPYLRKRNKPYNNMVNYK